MYLVIDAMAEKYCMLPTEVLYRATTQDLFIFNITNILKARANAKGDADALNQTYSQDELGELFNKARNSG